MGISMVVMMKLFLDALHVLALDYYTYFRHGCFVYIGYWIDSAVIIDGTDENIIHRGDAFVLCRQA